MSLARGNALKAVFMAAVVVGALQNHVYAASDGTLGVSSTGTTVITLNVPRLITAAGFSDIMFGEYPGFGDMEQTENVSISSNTQSTYVITAVGSCAGNSPANAFNISDGETLLPYTVYFSDRLGPAGDVRLTPSVPLPGRTNANFPVEVEADNASLRFVIQESDIKKARAGHYTGQISFSITTE